MQYADYEDVARELRVTTKTISNLVERGELPKPMKLGRKPLWIKREIFEYIDLRLTIDTEIKSLKQLSASKAEMSLKDSKKSSTGKRKSPRLTHQGLF